MIFFGETMRFIAHMLKKKFGIRWERIETDGHFPSFNVQLFFPFCECRKEGWFSLILTSYFLLHRIKLRFSAVNQYQIGFRPVRAREAAAQDLAVHCYVIGAAYTPYTKFPIF